MTILFPRSRVDPVENQIHSGDMPQKTYKGLEPGLYVLTEDLHNPGHIDLRCNDWMYKKFIPAGTLFALTWYDLDMELTFPRLGCARGFWRPISQKTSPELFNAVVAHLQHVDHTRNYDLLAIYHKRITGDFRHADDLIQALLDNQKIKVADIQQIYASRRRL